MAEIVSLSVFLTGLVIGTILAAAAVMHHLIARPVGVTDTVRVDGTGELNEIKKLVHEAKEEVLVLPRPVSSKELAWLQQLLVECAEKGGYRPYLLAYVRREEAERLKDYEIVSYLADPPKRPFVVVDRRHVILLEGGSPNSGSERTLEIFRDYTAAAKDYADKFSKKWGPKELPKQQAPPTPGESLVAVRWRPASSSQNGASVGAAAAGT